MTFKGLMIIAARQPGEVAHFVSFWATSSPNSENEIAASPEQNPNTRLKIISDTEQRVRSDFSFYIEGAHT